MISPKKILLDQTVFVGAIKVSAGSRHSAFISEFGGMYACGSSDSGQLGTGKRD